MISTKNKVADEIITSIATQYGEDPDTAIAWVIEDTRSTCECGKFFWNGCRDCDVPRMTDALHEALTPLKRLVHAQATDDELRAWQASAVPNPQVDEVKTGQVDAEDDDDDRVFDDYGNVLGSCNSCGEEIEEGEDCCDDGEFEPYSRSAL